MNTSRKNRTTVRELRSASLRVAAVATLVLNLLLGHIETKFWIYEAVTAIYAFVAIGLAAASILQPRSKFVQSPFVIVDALLVIFVLYTNILATSISANHGITSSGLAVAFIMLTHTSMNLEKRHVGLFCSLVAGSWVAMLTLMAWRHETAVPGTFLSSLFDLDLGLAISFIFTGCAVLMLVSDKDEARLEANTTEQRRHNLSRFFSPFVISYLQDASAVLDLERRDAAIMFVDLRDFTSYSEFAPPSELASVLVEYRRLVARAVVDHGGTVDKFIGDGVMAVFGQPKPSPDDPDRALACALHLTIALEEWRNQHTGRGGATAFRSAIGLHYGSIVGGVLESGFHDEFTVIGDTVNVAQRLEGLAKQLNAALVVSQSLLDTVSANRADEGWERMSDVVLPGRRGPIDIAYVPHFVPSDGSPVVTSPRPKEPTNLLAFNRTGSIAARLELGPGNYNQ